MQTSTSKLLINTQIKVFDMSNKSNSGKAAAAAMTAEQRKDRAMKGVEKRKILAGLPKALYEGKLKIGESELDVAVLDDSSRIITQAAIFKALDRPVRGTSRMINIPVFMDAQNLQPFIDEGLRGVISKVQYIDFNGKIQEGYNATIMPLVCDLYLST